MFQHPAIASQFAADHRRSRMSAAQRRRLVAGVGEQVAAAGLAAAEQRIAAVVGVARREGRAGPLVAVVADRTQPAVARERALGRLLAELEAAPAPDRPAACSAA